MSGFEIIVIILLLFGVGFLWGIVINLNDIKDYLKKRDEN